MFIGRQDIVGDLARLRTEFIGAANVDDDRLNQLEILAAAAVELGMSHNIVGKASGIPSERIDAVREQQADEVDRCAADYDRLPSGIVTRREPPST